MQVTGQCNQCGAGFAYDNPGRAARRMWCAKCYPGLWGLPGPHYPYRRAQKPTLSADDEEALDLRNRTITQRLMRDRRGEVGIVFQQLMADAEDIDELVSRAKATYAGLPVYHLGLDRYVQEKPDPGGSVPMLRDAVAKIDMYRARMVALADWIEHRESERQAEAV
jgi:hypothetical protein